MSKLWNRIIWIWSMAKLNILIYFYKKSFNLLQKSKKYDKNKPLNIQTCIQKELFQKNFIPKL